MALTEQQKQILDTINSIGNIMGLTEEQIIRAAAIAELESTLNPNAKNPDSSATGLYQYLNGSWKSSDGDRTNPVDATKRFIRDMKQYENEYAERNTNDAVRRRLEAMEREGIEPTLDNYIYYRHNRSLDQTRAMTDKWRRDKEGRFGEIRGYIDPDGSSGNPTPDSFLPWWIKRSYDDLINQKESLYRQLFGDALGTGAAITRRDPLIIDLDGDGIETTNVKDGAYFDHDGNGFAEQTGWAASDDGLLVMDRNNDGIINDGKELFGDQTILSDGTRAANGFQALSELDSNKDGKIDSNDAAFAQLKVWQDIDGDGYSTADELKSLSDVGITSINLNSTPSTATDAEGNTQTRTGSFEKADGTSGTIGEYNLQRDTAYTIANEWLDVPADIAALPDLQGYGNVYDLQQAIVRDASGQLKGLVEQFMNATDTSVRNSLIEQILFKWTGSEGIDPTGRGVNIDARKLAVLEKFFGQSFISQYGTNPIYESSILLKEAYRGLSEMMYSQLMAQTHLKPLYDKIAYTWDDAAQSVKADMSAVITDIQNQLTTDSEAGKQLLGEFARTIRGFGAQEMVNYLNFRETFIEINPDLGWIIDSAGLKVYDRPGQGQRNTSHIEGTDNADAVLGSLTFGDGYLNSLLGNDVIYGTERTETLINEQGDSVLVAEGGNDTIWAGEFFVHKS